MDFLVGYFSAALTNIKKLDRIFKGRRDTTLRVGIPGLQWGMDKEVNGLSGAGAKLANTSPQSPVPKVAKSLPRRQARRVWSEQQKDT